MSFKTLKATFKRNLLIKMRAYPKDFFIGNTLSALYITLAAYFMYHMLFKGNMDSSFSSYSGTSDYISYVVLGNCMYIFLVRTCLNVSRSLITELREGTLDSLMLAPFRRIQYFLGNMFEQTITTSGEIIVALLICLPFGVKFSNINILSAILAFLVSLWAYFSISILLACIMLYTRDTYISQNTLFLSIFILSGVTFPIQYLPDWSRYFSKIIPFTQSLDLIRHSIISGMSISSQAHNFICVFIMSSVYCVIGFKLLKHIEVIALEKINV